MVRNSRMDMIKDYLVAHSEAFAKLDEVKKQVSCLRPLSYPCDDSLTCNTGMGQS